MEINIQEIIELEDCSEFAIKKRNEETRRALTRYRHGQPKPDPAEKTILIKAMEIYKSQVNEGDAARYNALLYRNFASRPLKEGQIAKRLYINKRTVYKLLDLGTKDLTVILHGIGGLDLLPGQRSPGFIEERIQESITKRLTEELGEGIKNEFKSFIKEYQLNINEPEGSPTLERKAAQQQRVRETLKRVKEGNATLEEREELMQAMERYKATAANEKQDIAYNILFLFYITDHPLKAAQISDKYRINQRTVFKYITRGVEDLSEIMHDLKGGE
ncbi:MAG: hypothetical protein PHE09_09315 [Oscillospiraceae bacterium]|nr:hypothetical protein [Oscillospiraceae bacterium]